MTFESFRKFIPRAANRYGISTEMKAAHICHAFRELIPTLFPNNEHALTNIDAAHYKSTTLTISITSPAWAQEIVMRKQKIITALNDKFGKEVIKNLRTQLRRASQTTSIPTKT